MESICGTPWLIDEAGLRQWLAEVEQHAEITHAFAASKNFFDLLKGLSPEQSAAEQLNVENGTAYIKIVGVLQPQWNWVSAVMGDTTLDVLQRNLDAAQSRKDVKRIVLLIDSPGGRARGNDEVAASMFALRGSKPMTAYTDGQMCSAAYYIGSSADKIVASPSGVVGSVGSIMVVGEASKLHEKIGLKYTVLSFGEAKADGNQFEALTEKARARLQEYVDDTGRQFVAAVARNRGITEQSVRQTYGDGQAFLAQRALERGLIDAVMTLSELKSLGTSKKEKRMPENLAPVIVEANFVTKDDFAAFKSEVLGAMSGLRAVVVEQAEAAQAEKAASNRSSEILAKCTLAGCPERAAELVASNKSIGDVSTELLEVVCAKRKPDAGDCGASDVNDKKAAAIAEAKKHASLLKDLGVSQEDYVNEVLNGGSEVDIF